MVLEWRNSDVAGVRVTHWKKEDAQTIVDSISSKPLRIVNTENGPTIHVYAYGPHELAVRKYGDPARGLDIFYTLKQSVEEKAALTEIPFAKIRHLDGDFSVVTLWKKRTRMLHEYLRDVTVAMDDKKLMCKRVVKLVAKLHAAGYTHGHIKGDNVLVQLNKLPVLVDPRLLTKRNQPEGVNPWESRKKDFCWKVNDISVNFFEYCGQMIHHPRGISRDVSPVKRVEIMNDAKIFERDLEQHYHDHFDKLNIIRK